MKRKEFTVKLGENEKKLYFRSPTHGESIKIDLHYRKMFADAVRAGIMTHAEARKKYKENGAWTETDEAELQDIVTRSAVLDSIISTAADDPKEYKTDEVKEAVKTLEDLRMKAMALNSRKVELNTNTAEGFAEDQKMHKFIELCLMDADDDQSMFSSFNEYEKFLSEYVEAASQVLRNAYFFEYGHPDEVTADWAEVKYRKEELKNTVNALNEAAKIAEKEPEEDLEQKTKRKATKKKSK